MGSLVGQCAMLVWGCERCCWKGQLCVAIRAFLSVKLNVGKLLCGVPTSHTHKVCMPHNRHMERYDVRQLASLVGACVRAHYQPTELVLPLEIRLTADARRGHLQDSASDVAALATNLSRLRIKPARLWHAVSEAALACLGRAKHADVVALLAAHVRAEAANRKLFDKAVARMTADLRDAQPQDVATLMWALARSGSTCSRSLLRSLNLHFTVRGPEYGVLQLATVAGACAKMGVNDGELRRRLAQRGAEALGEEADALTSTASLGSRLLRQYGLGSTARAAQPVTSRAVAVLVTGLCSMGPAEPELLRAAVDLLTALAAQAAAGGAAAPDAADVEQVAGAVLQAGLTEEHAALRQACSPPHLQDMDAGGKHPGS
ncbi:hypothetical protein Agub_g1087 [Astrephomene gubernaculifera]|uniref:Uncharacterized protein n=1 Tax=Astrephomene gubernaculifera TaxID=47775 RepID=A0AAD3HH73_9CHLO|nr:hypothetical protein Agub_g1087 [Astrephomene gubernaculifera]